MDTGQPGAAERGAAPDDRAADVDHRPADAGDAAADEFGDPDIDSPPYVAGSGWREQPLRDPGPADWITEHRAWPDEPWDRTWQIGGSTGREPDRGPGPPGWGQPEPGPWTDGRTTGVGNLRARLIDAPGRDGWPRCVGCGRRVAPRIVDESNRNAAIEFTSVVPDWHRDAVALHPSCRRAAERTRARAVLRGFPAVAAELVRGPAANVAALAGVVAGDVATAVVAPFRDAAAAVDRWRTAGFRIGHRIAGYATACRRDR